MEFKGKVKKVFEREFTKRDGEKASSHEIWVEEMASQYPQSAVFEVGKNATLPKEGDLVTIQFSMSTNEWNDRVFGKNRAWKIEIDQASQSAPEEIEDPLSVLDEPDTEKQAEPTTPTKKKQKPEEAPNNPDDMPF